MHTHDAATPILESKPSAPTRIFMDLPSSGPEAGSYKQILLLAGPLMLSSTGLMIMQLVDALFLARYSKEAVGAVVPSSMAAHLVISVFMGVATYTSTFVAHYIGSGRRERASAAVWQGLYFALGTGAVVFAVAWLADPLFELFGHEASVREMEAVFFKISCWFGPAALIGGALSGFFTGLGAMRTIMGVQLFGFLLNGVLDAILIFGHLGFPEMGIEGAAWATGISQTCMMLILAALFFRPELQAEFGTWRARAFDRVLFKRLLAFGFPSGFRWVVECLAWTFFLLFIGRLGTEAMAASSIAWRINGIAFFPLLGFSQAISILVGQAQGAGRSDLAARYTWRGVALAEGWMLLGTALFLIFPRELVSLFCDEASAQDFSRITESCVVLLRFVSLYCLLDGLNFIFLAALQGAGDTRWTFGMSAAINLAFLLVLWMLEKSSAHLYTFWLAATVCVMAQALIWMARFHTGRWKSKRVVEPAVA